MVGEQVRGARESARAARRVGGREPELAQVLSAFDRARSDATPILVSITGPPGIGKTRLRREVLTRIYGAGYAEAPHIVVQRSEAYGRGHALGAAADVLRAIISLPKARPPPKQRTRFVARLGPSTRNELTTRNRQVLARLLANEPLPKAWIRAARATCSALR